MALNFINYAIISSLSPGFLSCLIDQIQFKICNKSDWKREGCIETSQQPFIISKGSTGKLKRDSSSGPVLTGQGAMAIHWKSRNLSVILERHFSLWGLLDNPQIAQGGCGCPNPGTVQGQSGSGLQQLGLVGGVPYPWRQGGTRWSLRFLLTY